ncbi:MAG TPA: choice-of-anchor L domain-containing protein [Bacteroidia bacterium]|nr:choice-of-anchor L domain-containing protein [Bacteroidia bacterium]
MNQKKYVSSGHSHRPGLVLLFLLAGLMINLPMKAQLTVNTSVTANQLISSLLGGGLNVSNVTLNCAPGAYGTFSNGNTTNIGINNGIMLTTGQAANAIGPNNSASAGTCNGTSGADPQLTALEPLATEDPCILEFDMVPTCNNLQISFVFGSEEYPEFVNSGYNDAFGFFITGPGPACQAGYYNNTNVATLPNNTTIVTIDNVNNVNNSAYYVDNTSGTTIQYDGFTTILTRNVTLCPCQTYHFKLAIADAGDCYYDSGVFVDFMQCSTALAATSSFTPVSGCSACDGTATATASGGNPPYNYSWSPTGGTSATATGLCPGTYTCTITDQGGCTQPQTVTVTIPASGGVTATSTQTNVTCSGGNNGTATVTPANGSGNYSYSWAPSGGTSATATGLGPGTYTCTITDITTGCNTTQSFTITQPAPLSTSISGTDVTCNGGTNGSATTTPSGGSPGYTYSWAPSGGTGATANGLSAGSYTVTVSDANGCTTTQSVALTEPTALTVSVTSTAASCSMNTGTATASPSGGTPGYTYSWAPSGGTSATASNLAGGSYTVTVTDANGCTTTQPIAVAQTTALASTTAATDVACFGGTTGSATVTPTAGNPPYTYSWSSGGTSAVETGLGAGTYTVDISDNGGCTGTETITITQPTQLNATISSTDVACNGGTTGSATTSPSGGTPGYTYSWAPSGGSNASASGLSAGSYTVTITDANGCTTTQNATVTQPPALTSTSSSTNVLCNGASTGSASVNASGGTGTYTYSWTPSGGTGASAANLAAGSYTCNITDANGCTASQSFTITQPSALSVSTSPSAVCAGITTTVSATPSGGTGPYSYSWSNGSTSSSFTVSPVASTSYSVTITDANNCTTTGVDAVTVNSSPTASFSTNAVNGVFSLNGPTGDLCFTDNSSANTVLWNWQLGSDTSTAQNPCVTITPQDIGSYCAQLTVATANGCWDTAEVCIEITNITYSIPNVFTPNGDGTNDFFLITNTGMSSLHCEIYDRWGALIYEWNDPAGYWDGRTNSGKDAVDGVYYYVVYMTDVTGKNYNETGFVHLIRGSK